MAIEKFDFPSPNEEEVKVVKKIAKDSPRDLEGREAWILRNFVGGVFE